MAGWGTGNFTVFAVTEGVLGDGITARSDATVSELPSGWFRRFTKVLSLVPPDREPDDGPIAIGLTSGDEVHLLKKQGEHYTSSVTTPAALLVNSNTTLGKNSGTIGVWSAEHGARMSFGS